MLLTKNTAHPTERFRQPVPVAAPPPAAVSPTSIARPQSLDVAIPHDASLSTAHSRVRSPSKNSHPLPEKVCEHYGVVFTAVSVQLILV